MDTESSTNDKTEAPDSSRRRFLTLLTHGGWLTALGIVVYQMGRFLGTRGLTTGPSPLVRAGTRADFPPGTTTYVSEARAWVQNERGTLTALDAVCPHLGCLVQKREGVTGFHCPCHGSEFGPDGALEHGPAEHPLRPLNVQTTPDDTVIIRIS